MYSNSQRRVLGQEPKQARVKPAGRKRPQETPPPVIVDQQGRPFGVEGLLKEEGMGLEG